MGCHKNGGRCCQQSKCTRDKPANTLLVAGSDKLHNLTCTVRDVRRDGIESLSRFGASLEDQGWYYSEIGQILAARDLPMAKEYSTLLVEFKEALLCNANVET